MRIAVDPAGDPRSPGAVHDRDGTMAGRGAYLCRGSGADEPAAACVAIALRRGAIARTLHAAVTLDPKIVESVSR